MNFLWGLVIILGLILQVFVPGFPKETLLIQAGISFGVIIGTIINWVGMVIGAQIAYEAVQYSHRFASRFSDLIAKYEDTQFYEIIEEKGNKGLFLIRLIPYAPNDILSMLSGILLLPRLGFLLVSMVTALPYAFVFAYIGQYSTETIGTETVILINIGVMSVFILAILILHLTRSISSKFDNEQI